MADVVRFTVVYPDDLHDPIIDTTGDRMELSDQSNAAGRLLDVDIAVEGKKGRTARLDEDAVRVLRDRLTAWLDAPRDAARLAVEPVVGEED